MKTIFAWLIVGTVAALGIWGILYAHLVAFGLFGMGDDGREFFRVILGIAWGLGGVHVFIWAVHHLEFGEG